MYEVVVECMIRICDLQLKGFWDFKIILEVKGLFILIVILGFFCVFVFNCYLFGFIKLLSLFL